MPITLSPVDPATDAEALHMIFGDEEQCRYLTNPPCASVAETRALLERYGRDTPDTRWTIRTEDGTIAGTASLFQRHENIRDQSGYVMGETWEIGFMIAPEFQGRGIAYDACCQAIDMIDALARPRRIESDIDPDNPASIRLCERLGFRHEGTLRKKWRTHIGIRDTYLMSLVDDDPRPWR